MTVRIVHKNSSASGKNPTSSQLANAELAINYHSDGPFLSLKDSAGNIIRVGGVWISKNSPPDPKKGALWVDPDNNTLYVRNDAAWIPIAGGGGGAGGDVTAVAEGPGIDVADSAGPIPKVSIDLHAQSGLETDPAGDGGKLRVNAGTGLQIAADGSLEATGGGLTYIGVVSPDSDADLKDADVGDIYASDVTTVNGTNSVTAAWYTCITNLASPADVSVGDLLICTTAGGGTPANSRYTRLATGGANQITTINANEGLAATVTGGNTVNLAIDLHQTGGTADSGLETDPAGNGGELRVNVGPGIEINASNELQVDADAVPIPGTGDFGFWNRTEPAGGDVLSPRTAGDDVFTSGDVRVGNNVGSPNTLLDADGTITSASITNADDATTGTGLLMSTDAGKVVRAQPKNGIEINSGQIQIDADNVPAPPANGDFGYWTRTGGNTLQPRTANDNLNQGSGTITAGLVNVSGAGNNLLKLTSTSAETNIRLDNSGATNNFIGANSDDFFWQSNGAKRMQLDGGTGNLNLLTAGADLIFNGTDDSDTAGTISIQAPTGAAGFGTYQLTLPTTDGNANQVLQTDGSGTLSWANAGTNFWQRSGTTIKPAANGDTVEVTAAGGATKISLEPDGDASFAGTVGVGTLSTGNGELIGKDGFISIRRDGAFYNAFNVYQGGTADANRVATIANDGSAAFAGLVEVSDGTGTIKLNADGTAYIKNGLLINSENETNYTASDLHVRGGIGFSWNKGASIEVGAGASGTFSQCVIDMKVTGSSTLTTIFEVQAMAYSQSYIDTVIGAYGSTINVMRENKSAGESIALTFPSAEITHRLTISGGWIHPTLRLTATCGGLASGIQVLSATWSA